VSFRKSIIGLALCGLLSCAASASAAVPRDFFGIVSEDVFTGAPAYRDATLAQESSVGIGLIRQTFHWKNIEVRPGVYNFAGYDAYVGALASHGIRVLPILFDPPSFRARVSHTSSAIYPPRSYSALGAFGAAVARRYGPNGSFWAQNPAVPKLPITAYQIWNEPNLKAYWPTGPNPRQYVRLLKAARAGIRRADPHGEIVTAGLPDSHLSRPHDVYRFLRSMMAAGGRKSFDTLAVNPYGKNTSELLGRVRRFRSILNHAHDSRSRIWITEFGWSDAGPRSSFRAGSAGQAKLIRRTIPALVRQRRHLGLRGLIYYDWRDAAPYPPAFKDFWGLHTGLIHRNGRAKPALAAFKAAVSAAR
jgi:polysaccharide biosynthesis protein PslG